MKKDMVNLFLTISAFYIQHHFIFNQKLSKHVWAINHISPQLWIF